METRANYALIGGLVILAAALVAGFVLWLGQSEFSRDYKAYDIVFDGPVSLEEGAAVRYIGIKVGEVATVRVDRGDSSKVRARVRVSRETPVREDSSASIQLAGITGTTFIQITAGTGRPLEARAGEPVPVIRSERTLVDQIVAGGAQALGRANLTFDNINKMLTDENIASVNATLKNIEIATGKLAADDGLIDKATAAVDDVSRAAVAFEKASVEFQEFGDSADTSLAAAAEDLKILVADLRTVAKSASGTLDRSAEAVAAATAIIEGPATETFQNAGVASKELRIMLNRFDRFLRELESNPQSLLVGEAVPYEEKR
ncbi:virulence factor Mce-like protein [Hyphomonas polymorpha PS728]|uniref:Virulence factor Mce-like protein n=1 Tax=Hyphomonas polymorpha PS728 TaxID=1280954 RepID=A0A062VNF1_9PROT|nr:MlaD family protein [Hyphomonas polymorpha]KDA00270.1 virulence factor Mce-like protein [Hyphomonas polymorpha PS728]